MYFKYHVFVWGIFSAAADENPPKKRNPNLPTFHLASNEILRSFQLNHIDG